MLRSCSKLLWFFIGIQRAGALTVGPSGRLTFSQTTQIKKTQLGAKVVKIKTHDFIWFYFRENLPYIWPSIESSSLPHETWTFFKGNEALHAECFAPSKIEPSSCYSFLFHNFLKPVPWATDHMEAFISGFQPCIYAKGGIVKIYSCCLQLKMR